MTRPYAWDLHQSGATDRQAVTWDDALGRWVPGSPAASDLTTAWVALTTSVGGVPDLIWTSTDELIYVEVPIP